MIANEPTILIVRLLAGIAIGFSLYFYGRERGVFRRDIAWLTLAMGGIVWLTTISPPLTVWETSAGIALFGTHPLLLVRLLRVFHPVPPPCLSAYCRTGVLVWRDGTPA